MSLEISIRIRNHLIVRSLSQPILSEDFDHTFLEEMFGRTFFVILFFWAALTVITPILVRLSASANLLDHNEIKNGDIQIGKGVGLLSRRALGSIGRPQEARRAASLSPSPSPSPSSFDLEVSDGTSNTSLLKRKTR